jgi:hypothetical protein
VERIFLKRREPLVPQSVAEEEAVAACCVENLPRSAMEVG